MLGVEGEIDLVCACAVGGGGRQAVCRPALRAAVAAATGAAETVPWAGAAGAPLAPRGSAAPPTLGDELGWTRRKTR